MTLPKLPTKEEMRALYWQTRDALEALDAANAALIAERDAWNAQFEPKARALNQRVKQATAPRFELAQQLAMLAKALGGQFGERPAG